MAAPNWKYISLVETMEKKAPLFFNSKRFYYTFLFITGIIR